MMAPDPAMTIASSPEDRNPPRNRLVQGLFGFTYRMRRCLDIGRMELINCFISNFLGMSVILRHTEHADVEISKNRAGRHAFDSGLGTCASS